MKGIKDIEAYKISMRLNKKREELKIDLKIIKACDRNFNPSPTVGASMWCPFPSEFRNQENKDQEKWWLGPSSHDYRL